MRSAWVFLARLRADRLALTQLPWQRTGGTSTDIPVASSASIQSIVTGNLHRKSDVVTAA